LVYKKGKSSINFSNMLISIYLMLSEHIGTPAFHKVSMSVATAAPLPEAIAN
jgi:hypothetical protein